MAINIKSAKTINLQNGINCLVSGKSGLGKTYLASTAPTPLVISVEGGMLSLNQHDIDVVECTNLDQIKEVYQFVSESKDADKYQTVVLDSVSEIAEIMLSEYTAKVSDNRQAYMRLNQDMVKLIRSFRDVSKNVYFIAKEGAIADESTGIIKYGPIMPGKALTNGLPFYFDEVMALRIKDAEGDKPSYRYLQTQPCNQYHAKDRSGRLNAIEKPDLTAIFDKIKSDKKG